MILNQKGTRRAEKGEDRNGLEMTILKSLANLFQNARTVTFNARYLQWATSLIYTFVMLVLKAIIKLYKKSKKFGNFNTRTLSLHRYYTHVTLTFLLKFTVSVKPFTNPLYWTQNRCTNSQLGILLWITCTVSTKTTLRMFSEHLLHQYFIMMALQWHQRRYSKRKRFLTSSL